MNTWTNSLVHLPHTFPVWVMHHSFDAPAIFYGPTKLKNFSEYEWQVASVPAFKKRTFLVKAEVRINVMVEVEALNASKAIGMVRDMEAGDILAEGDIVFSKVDAAYV
jgi:hypothetical protein